MPEFNPNAIFVGGVSGVHRGRQLYFANDAVTPLALPYDAVLTFSVDSMVAGTFFAPAGTLLSDAASWSGPLAAIIAANYSGTASHTVDADFAKLTFAGLQGYTFSNAKPITVKIQALKDGELSQNAGAFLTMTVQLSTGNLFSNTDIDLRGGLVYSSNYTNEASGQGLTNIRIDNTWSKNNLRAQVDTGGVHGRVIADTESATGLSLIYNQKFGNRLDLWRSKIDSFDVDGFPNYSTPEDIKGQGIAGAAASGVSEPCAVETLFSNGMPLMLIGKVSSTKTGSIMSNSGTAAAPDYSLNPLRMANIDASLVGLSLMRSDSNSLVYVPRGITAGIGQLSRLSYSGANNSASALVTLGNWANLEIGSTLTISPAANGNGQTFAGHCYGVAINEDLIVNAEPTLYVTDNTNHVIWIVTRNLSAFGDGRDWDWTIWAGTAGTAGNVDGIGLAAQLNTPRGIIYDGSGLLYVNCFGARTMRTIDTTTASVVTFFGQVGVGAHVDQFDY